MVEPQLTSADLAQVRAILRRHLPRAAVCVFGSRATGRARPFSDLDLLVLQPATLDWHTRVNLVDAFEASDLPFRVDVVENARLAPGMRQRVMAEAIDISA
jgi:uncharacterized protein